METLNSTEWDVVIAGTGFPQSLLALSLSRSGKKVLHVDRNDYYGGDEAALSLSEAEEWASKHTGAAVDTASTYSHASVSRLDDNGSAGHQLSSSRAYSLALAPQLIYSRSSLLSALVSSRTHNQLDFQAVGSWFTVSSASDGSSSQPKMTRVPSGREDIFRDDTLDLRAKRSLMKFLRFIGEYDEESDGERWDNLKGRNVTEALKQEFGVPDAAIPPLLALVLAPAGEADATMEHAVPRIARHLRSIGMFGPGFSAVLPKWGGLAEIAQVACRACAVGGGVYVLGKGVKSAIPSETGLRLELSGDEKLTTKWLVGCPADLPPSQQPQTESDSSTALSGCIAIVSSPLTSLFPPTSEGGVTPAGAVAVVSLDGSNTPVHILIHTSEAGECPSTQCVVYASTSRKAGFVSLENAVNDLLQSVGEQPTPRVLWKLQFEQQASSERDMTALENVITLPPLSTPLVLEDDVLGNVKKAWQQITGKDGSNFLKLEARGGLGGEDDETF